MISAPNHQQLLNGSKLLLFLLVALVFTSCDPTKKIKSTSNPTTNSEIIKSRTKKNQSTGKIEIVTEVTGKMDTINWKRDNSIPPITSNPEDYTKKEEVAEPTSPVNDGKLGESVQLGKYKIAVLLPFNAQKYNNTSSIPKSAQSVLDFYGGMKMAVDQLQYENVNISISVLDTQKSEDVTKSLLNRSELINADVIIGPTKKKTVSAVRKFALQNKKTMISPVYPSGTLATNNPFFVQVSPSLVSHCQAITQHVRKTYDAGQIVLIAKEGTETKRFKYFQSANKNIQGATEGGRFKEYPIQSDLADFDEINFDELILPAETTVFIIPSWSDEKFINNFLRMVSIAKGQNEVVVYGMPQWIDFNNVDFDYYRRLNVHVSSSTFIDKYSVGAKDFRRDFFNKYGSIPLDDAFKGYDILLYTGRMLKKHGNKFQQYLDKEEEQYNHTKFSFETVTKTKRAPEDYSINKFENKYVNILKFEDYQFKLAK